MASLSTRVQYVQGRNQPNLQIHVAIHAKALCVATSETPVPIRTPGLARPTSFTTHRQHPITLSTCTIHPAGWLGPVVQTTGRVDAVWWLSYCCKLRK